MANALKGEAAVDLEDGRKLTFCFDVNAWIDIGEELGKVRGKDFTPDEIIAALQDKKNPPGLKLMRVMIWGGLRKYHPDMTIRDAGAIMAEAAPAMEAAMSNGLPVEEEGTAVEADANPPKSLNGRGTVSETVGQASA